MFFIIYLTDNQKKKLGKGKVFESPLCTRIVHSNAKNPRIKAGLILKLTCSYVYSLSNNSFSFLPSTVGLL